MNVIFWHICGLCNYKYVVNSQFNRIKRSGLLNDIDKIYVTYLGKKRTDIDFLLQKSDKIILDKYDSYIQHYERVCLHSLHDFAKQNHSNVLYIHAKGVSEQYKHEKLIRSNINRWRQMMEFFLIDNYKDCLRLLNENDALGCCLVNSKSNDLNIGGEEHAYHFSGNFWWSKTEYIKTLPRIREDIVGNLASNCAYHLCERWILQKWPNVKLVELYKDPYNTHFYGMAPDIRYKQVSLNEVISI